MISLLISKASPAQAQTTLSPFLKSAVPLGSFGTEHIQAVAKASQIQDEKTVSLGWKLESLNNAADSILKSATRLEEEMRKETEYWEQAMSLQDKGWSVCRLPRERHTLGVRYGFLECMGRRPTSQRSTTDFSQLLQHFATRAWQLSAQVPREALNLI